MKILMVCLGNICRSPLAEGIMKEKIRRQGLDWTVDSAGTGSWHIGQQPDPRSRAVARKYGIDISGQRARQFSAADLEEFDLILAMDRKNLHDIQSMSSTKAQKDKVRLIMEFTRGDNAADVPDPYWDDDGFELVYDMLTGACDHIVEQWVREKQSI